MLSVECPPIRCVNDRYRDVNKISFVICVPFVPSFQPVQRLLLQHKQKVSFVPKLLRYLNSESRLRPFHSFFKSLSNLRLTFKNCQHADYLYGSPSLFPTFPSDDSPADDTLFSSWLLPQQFPQPQLPRLPRRQMPLSKSTTSQTASRPLDLMESSRLATTIYPKANASASLQYSRASKVSHSSLALSLGDI